MTKIDGPRFAIRFAAPLLAAAMLASPSLLENPMYDWDCNQLVLIGRVTSSQDLGQVDTPDLGIRNGGYGLSRVEIDVRQVLRGEEGRRRVTAETVTHAGVRQNREMAFYLDRGRDGAYSLRSVDADLGRVRRLLKQCDSAS